MEFTNAQLRQFKKKLFEGKLTENSPNIQGQRLGAPIGPKEPIGILTQKGILSKGDEKYLQEFIESINQGGADQSFINSDTLYEYLQDLYDQDNDDHGEEEVQLRRIISKLRKAKVVTVFGL